MQYTSDFSLLVDIKKGKESAFRYCYNEYLPIVRGWMKMNGGTDEDSDDLFQEALLVLFDKVKKEDFELTCKLSTYLLSICKYSWFNKQRKKSNYREVDMDKSPEMEMVERDMEYFQQQESHYSNLENALNKLGSPCKEVLEAFYLENRSMDEISDIMNYTNANNAKTQKYKCLNRLKKLFKKELKLDEQFRLI